jgi:hypothetical protein
MSELTRKLVGETARIRWHELERHFARGVLVTVERDLNLLEVAERMAADDATVVGQWLAEDRIRRTTTAEAERWADSDTEFWCVVVAPWALVQEITAAA